MKPGDKVQWTDYVITRNSTQMIAREGKLVAINGGIATVERRKQRYQVPLDEIRGMDEDSPLNEYVKGMM